MYNRFNTYLLALFLSVFAFIGCKSDDLIEGVDRQGNTLVLRLGLSAPSGYTRATSNPAGGEYGDGWRVGQYNENNVYDVYLYKYSSADGINAADETPVKLLAFQKGVNFKPTASDINNSTGVITKDIEFNVGEYIWKATGNDHFIACINTDNFGENTTLGKLRNEQIIYTCQSDAQKKDYDRFTMANAEDSYCTGGMGTKADPYLVEINVERTAARIDFAYSSAAKTAGKFHIEDGKYIYKIADSKDEVHLTHVRATNVMQNASYLIKRLATDVSETPVYLEEETDPAQKYVIEPTTWIKTIQAAENKALKCDFWFGNSWYMTAHETYNSSWFRDQDRVHSGTGDAFSDGTTLDEKDGDWQYYVLDYANENTMMAEQTLHHYTTGLVLKTTYLPETVYKDATLTEDNDYSLGKTFWRWHNIETNEDLFFSNAAAANDYQSLHAHSVVYEYINAQSYYNVWLRHENIVNDPTTTMMEFGIVRNNIYRVCVEFTGIGMPDVPENIVTPENIIMYIFVRKWNLIEHPVIEI